MLKEKASRSQLEGSLGREALKNLKRGKEDDQSTSKKDSSSAISKE